MCGNGESFEIIKSLSRLRLIHWDPSAADACLARLRQQGHDVVYSQKYESWKEEPPDAYVIDLSRLPSHGREVAVALRTKKSTRAVPIVFVEGAPEKVEALRTLFADATFTQWSKFAGALKKAIANPPLNPVSPTPMMARYAGRSASQKLGIKKGAAVAAFDPPHDYLKILGELPTDVRIEEDPRAPAQVTLCFIQEHGALPDAVEHARRRAAKSKVWLVWRKQSSGHADAINQNLVRESALSLGLVDYKICSINDTWTAMLFAPGK